jgi:DNA-binding transcriptional MocR family regulator
MAATLWADPKIARDLEKATATYGKRREAFISALADHDIEAKAPSGLNVWIPVPDETSTVQALREDGWAVAPGAPFRLQAEPAIRVTISTLQADEAKPLAAAIVTALEPSPRTRPA